MADTSLRVEIDPADLRRMHNQLDRLAAKIETLTMSAEALCVLFEDIGRIRRRNATYHDGLEPLPQETRHNE